MPTPPDAVNNDEASAGARRGLLGAGATVGGLTMLSRVLGLVRDVVIATIFGAQPAADAFFVAFRIPNLFRRLFAEGAFSQGFVPVLAEYRARRSLAEVRRLVAHVAGLLGLVLAALTLVGMLGAEYVIAVFAPGFEAAAEGAGRAALAADMLRITFPYLLLISLTALCGGVLNSYGHFAVPAFTPVWLNVCLILAALGLAPRLDEPVMALAWGVLMAGIVQLMFQFPAMARRQLLALPRPSVRDEGVRRVWKLMLPAAFGASVGQLNLLVDTLLASFLGAGSIAWLYYADRLMELPLGVFAIALSTVLLPSLSREHALADGARFSRMLDAGLKLGLLLTVPAATALVVLAVPLIATLFGHGVMGGEDVVASARALQAYALGLLGFTGVKILAPGFFARQDTRTPVRIAVIAVGVNVALNLALILPLAHVGLALATSVAACVNAGLLLRGLRQEGVFTPAGDWGGFLGRLGAACAVLGGVLAWLAPPDQAWLAASLTHRILWLAGLIALGLGLYFGTLALAGYGPRRLLALVGSEPAP